MLQINRQNLINQASRPKSPLPKAFYKEIVFDICSLGCALAFSWAYNAFLSGRGNLWFMLISLAGLCVFSSLQTLLSKNIWHRLAVVLLEGAALVSFFATSISLPLLAGMFVGVSLLLLWAEASSHRLLENSLKLRHFTIIKPHINKIVTACVLLMILAYLPKTQKGDVFISQTEYEKVMSGANSLIKKISTFDLNTSIQELAEDSAAQQLDSLPAHVKQTPGAQEAITQQVVQQFVDSMNKTLDIVVSPQEKLGTVVYNFLLATLTKWQQQFGTTFLVTWAIVAFLIVRSVGLLFTWPTTIISFLAFELLVALQYIGVYGENTVREVTEYT